MDVLYCLGNGSKFHDAEIKYSIALLKKFAKFDRIFIVGKYPEGYAKTKDVVYIPFDDQLSRTKNVFLKICMVASDCNISENFLYMMDDVFILNHIDIENYPLYHSNEIKDFPKEYLTTYLKEMAETKEFLKKHNKPVLNYGVHCPIVYNRDKIKEIDSFYWKYVNSKESKYGLNPRVLYGNWFEDDRKQYIKDIKLTRNHNLNQLISMLQDKEWFSVGSQTFGRDIQQYLKEVLNGNSLYHK